MKYLSIITIYHPNFGHNTYIDTIEAKPEDTRLTLYMHMFAHACRKTGMATDAAATEFFYLEPMGLGQ